MTALPHELSTALRAVTLASRLTQHVFHSIQSPTSLAGTITKQDKSPVTAADYGSQALVHAILRKNFPDDPIAAEEDSGELRTNGELRDKVWGLVRETLDSREDAEVEISSAEEMLDLIDLGGAEGGAQGRIWFLDKRS
jgi:3'-phosphoadenosine 5'-phosphosulfate (PAPS) 3'-phosphatase